MRQDHFDDPSVQIEHQIWHLRCEIADAIKAGLTIQDIDEIAVEEAAREDERQKREWQ